MNGLKISQDYWETIGRPAFQREFPGLIGRMAVGLAGEGSECFGYDDAFSRDHDWGPGFCIWLTQIDAMAYGPAIREAYRRLPRAFAGYPSRRESPQAGRRVGCFSIPEWYTRYVGCPGAPESIAQWRRIPEHFLATAVNGSVFQDPVGEFTAIRRQLLAFYPEDVRRKKLAHRLAVMAQAGQYNYPRCLRRGEVVAASLALHEFMRAGMSAVYLLNRRYAPFYKWMHRGIRDLPVLPESSAVFTRLVVDADGRNQQEAVEEICRMTVKELLRQDLSQETETFLMPHAQSVFSKIEDAELRSTHIMED